MEKLLEKAGGALIDYGIGGTLFLLGLGVAYYFHRQYIAAVAECRATQKAHTEDVRSMAAVTERVNAALAAAAALSEARDATARQLVEALKALTITFSESRSATKDQLDRIERGLE